MPRRSRKDKTANQQLDELNQYSPVIIPYAADSDHSTAKAAFVAPFAMCTGITCAADGAVSRLSAGAVVANDARLTLAAGDTVKILSSGGTAANTRGHVTFIGVRL